MKVLFYGRLAEAIGPELEVDAGLGCSVAELRKLLVTEHPHAEEALQNKRTRTVVGDTLVPDNYCLAAGDTLEFLPSVSGG